MAAKSDDALTSAELSRLLDDFEEAIEELRISYEKYFLGVERVAPAQRHKQLKAQLRRLERHHMRSTALRFRLQGLRARVVTYEHYWTRVLGQIERGTFRRDLQQRAARRTMTEPAGAPRSSVETPPPEIPASAPEAPSPSAPAASPGRSLPPLPPTGARLPPPPPPSGPPPPPVPGMKSTEVRALFENLVQAKQAAGEDTRGLTVRALARKLSRELPKLQERHGGRVEFEVATVGGKVTLRARAREG